MHYGKPKEKIETPFLMKIILLAGGFLLALIITRIFITPYKVGNNSMIPTYDKGALVFIHKHITPQRGDAVLFYSPAGADTTSLKRVLALPGETVEISDKSILINGKRFEPKWKSVMKDARVLDTKFSGRDTMSPRVLGADEYFLVGDNMDESMDSRETGPVKQDEIIGRVFASF